MKRQHDLEIISSGEYDESQHLFLLDKPVTEEGLYIAQIVAGETTFACIAMIKKDFNVTFCGAFNDGAFNLDLSIQHPTHLEDPQEKFSGEDIVYIYKYL